MDLVYDRHGAERSESCSPEEEEVRVVLMGAAVILM